MTNEVEERKEAWIQWRTKPSLKRKLAHLIRERELSRYLDTLVGHALRDSTGLDAMREENRKLRQLINDTEAKIASNEQQITRMEAAVQQTEVELQAESRFREIVKSRDPRRMDITMWRNLSKDHSTAQLLKPEARKRIIKEEVGVDL